MRAPRNIDAAVFRRADGMEAEILQEKASNLQRLGSRLQDALSALEEFDRRPGARDAATRESLVTAAGEALWYYVVQREVSGLRDTDRIMRELAVPREVQLRMGFRRPGPRR